MLALRAYRSVRLQGQGIVAGQAKGEKGGESEKESHQAEEKTGGDAEIARRKPETLSTHQRALLEHWGYPFVMDEFRFHITLTGRLAPEDARTTRTALLPVMGAMLPAPFVIDALCLFGEDQDGMFHYISRHTLAG